LGNIIQKVASQDGFSVVRSYCGHGIGTLFHSAPRYIFTKLCKVVKVLFNDHDNELLEYLDDDGMSIEPKYYIPVIPMILINGAEGIGTGYSTNIPCYNPKDVILNLKKLIIDPEAELTEMIPWYKGFKGTIVKDSPSRYITTGKYRRVNDTSIEITELPIGKWTQVYKEFLDSLIETNEIVDYKNNSDDLLISFTVIMQKSVIDELISKDELIKKFKLTSILNTSNMNVFDSNLNIKKMSCPEEIIYEFFLVRREHFVKRKNFIISRNHKFFC
jgi:DNA topoisomerase-2